nr:hypothetical protein [Tanacetum cinerariifolium]
MSFKVNKSKDFCKEREQYLKAQLQDKGVVIRVILTTSVSRPQLKSNPQGDRVLRRNSRGKKLDVEEHRRNVKFPKKKTMLCVIKFMAKPIKKIAVSESNKKPRKLYERVSKTCSWWYSEFTPSGYIWKPKSGKEHVNPNASIPLGNVSRTANVKDTMTSRRSIVSNSPLSSNSFAAHRDCSIHHRLWLLKAHDEKSQASN